MKFQDSLPSAAKLTLNNSLLSQNGRTVADLGPSVNDTDKTIVFGAFSFGTQDGVNGNLLVLTIKTLENSNNITIIKEVFLDKDANALTLNSELK